MQTRHNPPIASVKDLLAMLRAAGKFPDLVDMIEADPDFAKPLLAAANAVIAKIDAKKAAKGGAGGKLTDSAAWKALANLVDSTLGELPAGERNALKAAFLAEASR